MMRAVLVGFAGAVVVGLAVLTGGCESSPADVCPSQAAIVPGAGCNDNYLMCLADLPSPRLACDGTPSKTTTITLYCICINGLWVSTGGSCGGPPTGYDGSVSGDDSSTSPENSTPGDDSGGAAETSAPGSGDGSPGCSATESCVQNTSQGRACLPSCSGVDGCGCSNGNVCTVTSGCCSGTGCSAIAVHVCCPASGC